MGIIGCLLVVLIAVVIGLVCFPLLANYYDKIENHFNIDKEKGENSNDEK
jgi:hypothetical protein